MNDHFVHRFDMIPQNVIRFVIVCDNEVVARRDFTLEEFCGVKPPNDLDEIHNMAEGRLVNDWIDSTLQTHMLEKH